MSPLQVYKVKWQTEQLISFCKNKLFLLLLIASATSSEVFQVAKKNTKERHCGFQFLSLTFKDLGNLATGTDEWKPYLDYPFPLFPEQVSYFCKLSPTRKRTINLSCIIGNSKLLKPQSLTRKSNSIFSQLKLASLFCGHLPLFWSHSRAPSY